MVDITCSALMANRWSAYSGASLRSDGKIDPRSSVVVGLHPSLDGVSTTEIVEAAEGDEVDVSTL